jgi:hypothetical protein
LSSGAGGAGSRISAPAAVFRNSKRVAWFAIPMIFRKTRSASGIGSAGHTGTVNMFEASIRCGKAESISKHPAVLHRRTPISQNLREIEIA